MSFLVFFVYLFIFFVQTRKEKKKVFLDLDAVYLKGKINKRRNNGGDLA